MHYIRPKHDNPFLVRIAFTDESPTGTTVFVDGFAPPKMQCCKEQCTNTPKWALMYNGARCIWNQVIQSFEEREECLIFDSLFCDDHKPEGYKEENARGQ